MFHWRKSSYFLLICTVKMTTFEKLKRKKWYDDMIWDVTSVKRDMACCSEFGLISLGNQII